MIEGYGYEFEDEGALLEALRGEHGPEAERAAEGIVGSLAGGGEQPAGAVSDEEAEDMLLDEIERLWSRAGRDLTPAEIQRIAADLPATGQIPDLVEKYGEELASRSSTEEGRTELAAEYSAAAREAQALEEV